MTSEAPQLDVVTGAFSYTGRFIAEQLLAEGRRVRTLSRTPAPSGSAIESAPFAFDDLPALTASLQGAEVLYNTYWIRFQHGDTTFERAVENTRVLLRAALEAGVRRFVHVSVTNPSLESSFAYFRGKATLERDIAGSGLPYAIVRPTLIFGPKDILVNNIAWLLRRFPVFIVPGDGSYLVQPVSAGDTARICVEAARAEQNVVIDAAGPETFAFEELVALVRAAVGSRARLVHGPVGAVLGLARVFGAISRDVLLTREELDGLIASLLVSAEPPRGSDRFSDWVGDHGEELGRAYVSELARNFRHA